MCAEENLWTASGQNLFIPPLKFEDLNWRRRRQWRVVRWWLPYLDSLVCRAPEETKALSLSRSINQGLMCIKFSIKNTGWYCQEALHCYQRSAKISNCSFAVELFSFDTTQALTQVRGHAFHDALQFSSGYLRFSNTEWVTFWIPICITVSSDSSWFLCRQCLIMECLKIGEVEKEPRGLISAQKGQKLSYSN